LDDLYLIFLCIGLVYVSSFRRGGFGDKRPKVPGFIIFLYIVLSFLLFDELFNVLPRTKR